MTQPAPGASAGGARVVALATDDAHRFSKRLRDRVALVEGHGVEGDVHAGSTVRHRSRRSGTVVRPNLRQVHLLHSEFFDLAAEHGYEVGPGDLGENVLTAGLDLLALPRDTVLRLGSEATVRVTGLRSPCWQIDDFRKGLLRVALGKDDAGEVVRRVGVMSVVVTPGEVVVGDGIDVTLPSPPYLRLEPV